MHSLKAIATPAEKARIAVTFDDGWETAYTEGFTYAQGLGVKGTQYVVTDWLNTEDYMTTAQMDTMYAAGWDIASHTKAHLYFGSGAMSQAACEEALELASGAIEAFGYTRAARHVAYPGGENTANSHAAMLATGMITGRTVAASPDCLPSICQRLLLPCKIIGSAVSLATAKGFIDAAILSKRTLIVGFHQIATGDFSVADYREFIDYVVSTGIESVTISELYDIITNS